MPTNAKVAQLVVEGISDETSPDAQVAQLVVEVVSGLPTGARVAHVVIETISVDNPCGTPPDGEDLTNCIGPLLFTTWDALGEL